jgi:L-ascorbate metabolism protein UlaG (beta-lactamase superfamily)
MLQLPVSTAEADARPDLPRPVAVPGGGWRNPGRHENRNWRDVLRWKLTARPAPWPRRVAVIPQPAPPPPANGLAVTWVGHATVLVQSPGFALLADPVWSERIGPLRPFLYPRVTPPGVFIDSLQRLDAVVLSHDHYDHCDLPTLRRLAQAWPQARLFAPLGHGDLAARAGFAPGRVALHDWWQTATVGAGCALTAVPARHWSNRLSGRRNGRLWCGWHLATPAGTVHFVGDTAYDPAMFGAIRSRLGPTDLAIVPIGAYAPRWFMRTQHCDPEEAVRIHCDLGARRSLGVHWGTFRLTDEPREEPPARFAIAARAAGLSAGACVTVDPGQTVRSAA